MIPLFGEYGPRMPDVILPVLNEVAALPWVLSRMPDGYRPIVVDNGSTDGSAQRAAGLGASVIEEPVQGFGSACYGTAALSAVTDRGTPTTRVRDMAAYQTATQIGLSVGPGRRFKAK